MFKYNKKLSDIVNSLKEKFEFSLRIIMLFQLPMDVSQLHTEYL